MAKPSWPKAPAFYQIYPRSFQDSTGDGVGDLPGVLSRLDHIAALGVDGIWLCPHYTSPWADGGYDVVDHQAVEPRLGTLADFDAIVARSHELGLSVMIDQVLNHTSCEHPWFRAALAGDDDMAERYLFRDPKPDGSPPNNWLSYFGHPGWTWSHERRQFHFHQFLSCQPSLNLRHSAVQNDHRAQIEFWRDRGVDGFRFDAVTSYLWDESLADNPAATPEVRAKVSGAPFNPYTYQDHVHDMLPGDGADYAETLRDWAGKDAYLIGEVNSGNHSWRLAMDFTGPGRLDACYTTDLAEAHGGAATVAEMIAETESPRIIHWLSTHDQPRHNVSGSPNEAAFFALLMAVLPGPWLIYQGEEWGLPQPHLEKHEVTDPFDLLYWPDGVGREGPRVPMPWAPGAAEFGFTTGTPWLPMRWDRAGITAAQATEGIGRLYGKLIGLRRERGWDLGTVADCAHGEDWLDLTLDTDTGPYRAEFRYSRDAPDLTRRPGDALFAVSGPYRGAIWPATS